MNLKMVMLKIRITKFSAFILCFNKQNLIIIAKLYVFLSVFSSVLGKTGLIPSVIKIHHHVLNVFKPFNKTDFIYLVTINNLCPLKY